MMSKDTTNSICTCRTKRKFPTCFEWFQLIVTFSVPVAIALYTFMQNNNEQAIALANREKDLEIARYQRAQDLQLADDQQKANILGVYESFLVSHLNQYGMTLNKSAEGRFIARLQTLTTVNQLDPVRRSFIIQSLFEAKLIVNDYQAADPYDHGIISLKEANLSDISLKKRDMRYLSLPNADLTRAMFTFSELSCVNFHSTILTDADFSHALSLQFRWLCFKNYSHTIFTKAKLTGANFFDASFLATDFSEAIFEYTKMNYFECIDCLFTGANMYRADLSFSMITGNSTFKLSNLTESILQSTAFRSTTFYNTVFIKNQAKNIKITQCLFNSTNFSNCILQQASIVESNFSETSFTNINLSESILNDLIFLTVTMHQTNLSSTIFNQCTFINVNFNDAIVQNASFHNCTFQNSSITNEQRLQAASFTGSVFS